MTSTNTPEDKNPTRNESRVGAVEPIIAEDKSDWLEKRQKLNNILVGYRKFVMVETGMYSFATEKQLSKKQALDAITSHIDKVVKEARLDELSWARNEVENDVPINVYDNITARIKDLQ